MNPNIQNLNSLQVAYDQKLMQYNIDIKDFLAETFAGGSRDTNFRKAYAKERNKLRKEIKTSEGQNKNLADLKVHQSLLFSDDSLVKAIMSMKKKEQDLELYPNTAYFGAGFLSGATATNATVCLKRCAANPKCTGAWFEQKGASGFCQLRQGAGPPGQRWMGRTAIQNKLLVLLGKVKEANYQLIRMNQEISGEIANLSPNLDDVSGENVELNARMANDYLRLTAQKEILQHGLQDYDSSVIEAQETERLATSHLLKFRFFYLFFILILTVPIVMSYYGIPSLWILMLLASAILMLLQMKTISFYLIVVTILYMAAFVVPISTS